MSVFGYVQAGGSSTRFGVDKALVELGGKSMLDRTCALLGPGLQNCAHYCTGRKNIHRRPSLPLPTSGLARDLSAASHGAVPRRCMSRAPSTGAGLTEEARVHCLMLSCDHALS